MDIRRSYERSYELIRRSYDAHTNAPLPYLPCPPRPQSCPPPLPLVPTQTSSPKPRPCSSDPHMSSRRHALSRSSSIGPLSTMPSLSSLSSSSSPPPPPPPRRYLTGPFSALRAALLVLRGVALIAAGAVAAAAPIENALQQAGAAGKRLRERVRKREKERETEEGGESAFVAANPLEFSTHFALDSHGIRTQLALAIRSQSARNSRSIRARFARNSLAIRDAILALLPARMQRCARVRSAPHSARNLARNLS